MPRLVIGPNILSKPHCIGYFGNNEGKNWGMPKGLAETGVGMWIQVMILPVW